MAAGRRPSGWPRPRLRSRPPAQARLPDTTPLFIAWPGTELSDRHHYVVFMRGDTPFTAHLFRPVLIDAGTGAFTATRDMPMYITVLLVSQPLHFGDYGGLPLKIVWAALDLLTIFMLAGGVWIWLRRKLPSAGLGDLASERVTA